jgi:SAM-dependent methyltransferase
VHHGVVPTAVPSPAPAERWRDELAAWAIPERILAAAPESPYGFPVGLFLADAEPVDTPSRRRALDALQDGGTVLDVGCGGGRASLALVPPATRVVGVDSSPEMLTAYADAAAARGVDHAEVDGSWPEAAARAGSADVVLAHHVFYNVPDLRRFVAALTAAAHRRVVVELTGKHPWVATRELWRRFHDLDRPEGPSADLAVAVLRSEGIAVEVERWEAAARPSSRQQAVTLVRRRLCLPADAEPDVDAALPADYELIPREVVTLWWDVTGPPNG